ncbi:MAG: lyase family protein, partial [Actinomadura sp.]
MPSDPDAGLLQPVWAGTEAAAACGDRAWLRALLDAEAGLVRAQARLGTVPPEAARAITTVAEALDVDLAGLAVRARGGGNPVIPLVAELRRAAPPGLAEYVHRGATSQDIMDTAAMLVAARTRTVILRHLDGVLAALAGLAAAHRDNPMAGRTLGQQAVPTTFGLKAAGWLVACAQTRSRLAGLPLPAQLGG